MIVSRLPHGFLCVLLLLVQLLVAHRSPAQCTPTWLELSGLPGFDNACRAFMTYDDGSGSKLYAVGDFQVAGGETALRVARFDGVKWSAMGAGLGSQVFCITVFNGQIYVGGNFTNSGATPANRVARWNGTAWEAVGSGFADGEVRALHVFNNELYAGGNFTLSGAATVRRIAKWTGSAWQEVGGGFGEQTVFSLTTFQNQLHAGGTFKTSGATNVSYIARFDGAVWQPLAGGASGGDSFPGVLGMLEFNSELYIAGGFTNVNGSICPYAARWNGTTWTPMPFPLGGSTNGARSLAMFNGTLYCAGTFGITGGQYFAKWNGSAWINAGATFNLPSGAYCLGVYANNLYIGGAFTRVNDNAYNRIVRFDGTNFSQVGAGFENRIRALTEFNGSLIIGGYFISAAGIPNFHVVRFDGLNYFSMPGLGGDDPSYVVTDFCTHNSELYATGQFSMTSGTKRVAKWTGSAWAALSAQPSSNAPNCIASFNGDLIVGGFNINGTGNHIVRYNGSSWVAMGSGLNNEVFDLIVYNNALYACGGFSASGATPMSFVARWDGTNWNAVGGSVAAPGTSERGWMMTIFGGDLVVGGRFAALGGVTVNNIARWNGATWSGFGSGFSAVSTVNAVANYNGGLAVGGNVNVTGFPTPNYVALWNGSAWSGFGPAFSGFVNGASSGPTIASLQTFNNELFVGGDFFKAGGRVSSFLAHWGSEPPCIQSVASSVTTCTGGSVTITAVVTGVPTLTYQWKRNNVDLVEGILPNGTQVSNVDTPSLSLENCQAADLQGAVFKLHITNSFGAADSAGSVVNVCAADFNCDGLVDDADFTTFVAAYNELLCPDAPAPCPCDLNADGLVEDSDFSIFVVAYNELICP